jgi:putative transposase
MWTQSTVGYIGGRVTAIRATCGIWSRRGWLPALPGGRPRKTDMRAAMNAILYLLRTGCPWRYLPRDSFLPRSTVYNIFRKFPARWRLACDLGRAAYGVARADGAGGQPHGGGSRQPVDQIGRKRGGSDNQVGYDASKRVKGRKIHALVDSEGCRCGSLSTPPRFRTATGPV